MFHLCRNISEHVVIFFNLLSIITNVNKPLVIGYVDSNDIFILNQICVAIIESLQLHFIINRQLTQF